MPASKHTCTWKTGTYTQCPKSARCVVCDCGKHSPIVTTQIPPRG
jgi:hypothetical protein